MERRETILERLGLARREQRAWALYDFANSVVITTVIAAVFPVYFQRVVAGHVDPGQATGWFGWSTSATLLAVALFAPILGPLADARARRKRYFLRFLVVGVVGAAALGAAAHGDVVLALVAFALVNVGAAGTTVFYDALLPHVARPDEQDRLSTSGFALGYLSGGLLLALHLAWIQRPELFGLPSGEDLSPADATLPTRLALASTAAWWFVFSVPLLLRVPEPPPDLTSDAPILRARGAAAGVARVALAQVGASWRRLRSLPDAARMLLAFLIYNDGILTIIRMAAVFGALAGFETGLLIGAILVVQFVGVPCAIAFAWLARKFGTKRAVLCGVGAYGLITLAAAGMRTEAHFLMLAIAVGAVQGGTQALSRSLFAGMVPRKHSTEFFALFAVLEKFAGVLGPALFGLVVWLAPDPRFGLLAVLPMFLIGGWLLVGVDVERGRAAARAVEAVA